MSDFEKRVKAIVAAQLGVAETEVKNESSFVDDLGADSLDTVELVMALEEEFGIEIPDEEAEKITTIRKSLQKILDTILGRFDRKNLDRKELYKLKKKFGNNIPEEKIIKIYKKSADYNEKLTSLNKEAESNFQKIIDDLSNKLYKEKYGEGEYPLDDILNSFKYEDLKEQEIDGFVINFITIRNEKLFEDILQWTDPEPNVQTDYWKFKRNLYTDIKWIILNMEMNGVEEDDKIYSVYSGSGEFKWWNNEYTIYANGRDKNEDEEENTLGNQLSTIADIVYNKESKGMKDVGKPAKLVWEGTLVDKNLAIDLAIRWDRNVWQSTAHLPEQGKFRGRLVTHAEVYAAVFESMMTAINTVNDYQGKLGKFGSEFLGKNKTSFMDKIIDKDQDKLQDEYFDQFEKDDD